MLQTFRSLTFTKKKKTQRILADPVNSRLRLHTIIRLRWIAVLGQLAAISIVSLVLGFYVPIGACLTVIALSAWLNVFLAVSYPSRHRLSIPYASGLLVYDILQLSALLFLTGGMDNPFAMLMVAPVTVSAATLPLRNTIALGLVALAAAAFLVRFHEPLPWIPGIELELPIAYKLGAFAALCVSTTFIGLYAWRLTKESRQMSAALTATDIVLAREQKLHALDGLAAAAAHELGTPLSTIVLVTKELELTIKPDNPLYEDIALLKTQALRCREILQKLTRHPGEEDPMHARVSVRAMLEEAAEPYFSDKIAINIAAAPAAESTSPGRRQAEVERRPGVIYGIGNIIENASEFAKSRVDVTAHWNASGLTVTIADDGPGFPAEVMDNIGEPYVTTRPAETSDGVLDEDSTGLGLGFFIAKTLLERSGATVGLANRTGGQSGAIVTVSWPRAVILSQ
ncbi:ActS/PrrB/RegB family redox-sensitive histidine kinase [Hyphomicrobium album]|uniref:ActS/PrrB/RegB family redox-sensitive histidine kinase n=1 Tax=Hyphomicrobium album TaxID=2665159 RepID=UPI001E524FB9|nr:ActS/PrrB/RegB family redox-sensitive histidine kinase [Hyphomicrobium album]